MELYILGNGFDLNNGLPTKYSDFAKWTKEHHNEDYKFVKKVFGAGEDWSNLEDQIAGSFERIQKFYQSKKEIVPRKEKYDLNMEQKFSVLLKEWLIGVCEEAKVVTQFSNEIIVNFNYTKYIIGPSVFNIHEDIYQKMSLHFGHAQQRMVEKGFLHKTSEDFNDNWPDPIRYYNQLGKNGRIAKNRLLNHLEPRNISKIVFFGFSFGKQDEQYFDVFNKNTEVDFYYKEFPTIETRARILKYFPKTIFIKSSKWNGL